ncbi:MAG: hypothetical protein HWD92_05470 [Flavobacteriia bacterium]|nr:hypothetical protein [Flavobacteriia bacterium]
MPKYFFIYILTFSFSLTTFGQVKRQMAQQAMDEGKYEEALSDWQDLYKSDGSDFYYEQIVDCFIQLEELEDAEDFIEDHIDKAQNRQDLYRIDLGYISLLQRDTTEAEDRFNTVLEAIYRQPGLAYQYSERFKKLGIFQFALGALETAERSNPRMAFDQQKAMLYAEMGMLEEMYISYLEVLEKNPNFLPSLKNVIRFNTNRDGEIPLAEVLKREIVLRIQETDDIVFNQLLIWTLTQEGQYRQAFRQLSALYRRTLAEPYEIFQLAVNAKQAGDFSSAIYIYEFLIEEESATPFYADAVFGKIEATHAQLVEENGGMEEFTALHQEMVNASDLLRGNSTRSNLLLLQAETEYLYLNQPVNALTTIEACINSASSQPKVAAEAKLLKGDIELTQGQPYDALLTYAQVETEYEGGILGQEARFRKARIAFYVGDFEFALIQFDVLKQSTSKLIANDALRLSLLIKDNAALDTTYIMLELYAQALMKQAQHRYDLALVELDSLDAMLQFSPDHPLLDEAMYSRARNLENLGQLDSAAELYIAVESTFGKDLLADESLIRAARIYQYQLYNLDKAKELYEKIVLEHGNSVYAEEARNEYRKLRGDLNS